MSAKSKPDRKHAAAYIATMIAPLRDLAALAGMDRTAGHLDAAMDAIHSDVGRALRPYSAKDSAANPPG